MSLLETLRSALESIFSHRSRSFLTVLGMLIGVAAVIVAVGIGQGSQQKVNRSLASLGSNLLIVTPGSTTSTGGVRSGLGSSSTLTTYDAQQLENKTVAPSIAQVAPVDRSVNVLTANGNNWTSPTIATVPSYLSIENRSLLYGQFLTSADERSSAPVIVLGSTVSTELFGGLDPVGQSVSIANLQFQVVGVLASAGSSSSTNQDDQCFVPLSTYQTLLGGKTGGSVNEIVLQATGSSTISAAYQEANALLLQLHQISNPAAADFTITSQTQVLSAALTVSQTLTFLLTGIAAVSLLVGGIGVMNIMLVSVAERVKEIGLRKALGATPGVIRNQFLLEALGLGLVGGFLGIALGFVAAYFVDHYSANHLVLSVSVVGGSVGISAVIALVFGVYPASRAARLTPIEALRSE